MMSDTVAFGFFIAPIMLVAGILVLRWCIQEHRRIRETLYEDDDDESLAKAMLWKILLGAVGLTAFGAIAIGMAVVEVVQ